MLTVRVHQHCWHFGLIMVQYACPVYVYTSVLILICIYQGSGHAGSMINADQCQSMLDQISGIDTNTFWINARDLIRLDRYWSALIINPACPAIASLFSPNILMSLECVIYPRLKFPFPSVETGLNSRVVFVSALTTHMS